MNKIDVKSVGAGKQITFESKNKTTFNFYYEDGNQQVDIWEIHPQGKILMAQKSDLPLKWLTTTIKHTISTLPNGKTFSMPTPLGAIFTFSKNDLIQLQNFLKSLGAKV